MEDVAFGESLEPSAKDRDGWWSPHRWRAVQKSGDMSREQRGTLIAGSIRHRTMGNKANKAQGRRS